MPEGGRLTIETANTYLDEAYARQFGDVTPGQYVMLSVTDTGSGIAPELLARAFEPFFTTKPAGQGSGLGLAMVHGFVKQSGGHVRIYSEVGQGTTVKLYLPRLQKEEEVASAPAPRQQPVATPRAASRETILLVEDNDGVRDFARTALEELGYTVLEAANAEAALRIIAEEASVDLLFTDVVLPGMSGRELANRALAVRPDLPVLYTTGYTRNAIIHNGRLDPGVQLLSKPFAQHDLARKVREMLDAGPAKP
jgi:CheY-like chemotaxis protein